MRFSKNLDISYSSLTWENRNPIFHQLLKECNGDTNIEFALNMAWEDFVDGLFKYDGATFVRERTDSLWEVAAFLHDWLNSLGYVGKKPDLYFIEVMIKLNYPANLIFERCKWMQYTVFNKLRHKLKGTFVADDLPNFLKELNDI